MTPIWMTVAAARRALHERGYEVSDDAIRNWARKGSIPSKRVGPTKRIVVCWPDLLRTFEDSSSANAANAASQ